MWFRVETMSIGINCILEGSRKGKEKEDVQVVGTTQEEWMRRLRYSTVLTRTYSTVLVVQDCKFPAYLIAASRSKQQSAASRICTLPYLLP